MDQDKRQENPKGQFAEVLELAQHILGAPMYRKVHQRYFNNTMIALLKRPEYDYSFGDGFAEYYLPTVINAVNRLQFHRVAIKVFEEIQRENVKELSNMLRKRLREPPGPIDSETIILVAPKANSKGLIRGFRHIPARGYLTAIVIANDPKVVWMRILALLRKFWLARIKELCVSLGSTELIDKELIENINRSLSIDSINFNSINIGSINETLETNLNNMLSTLQYFNEKLRDLSHEAQTIKPDSPAAEKPKPELQPERQLAATGPKCWFCSEPKNPAIAYAIHRPSQKSYPACKKHAVELQNYPDLWDIPVIGEEDQALIGPVPSNPIIRKEVNV